MNPWTDVTFLDASGIPIQDALFKSTNRNLGCQIPANIPQNHLQHPTALFFYTPERNIAPTAVAEEAPAVDPVSTAVPPSTEIAVELARLKADNAQLRADTTKLIFCLV